MIRFDVDTIQVDELSRYAASLSLNIEAITSHALNSALKETHEAMRSQLPQRIDRPTPWTTRGLLRRSSTPQNLTAAVGFNYGDGEFTDTFSGKGIGTPSGRYMDVQARGGARSAKSTERKLRSVGILDPGQFITPSGKGPGVLDRYGNVRSSTYVQLLAALRAGSGSGFSANTPRGSSTSGRHWFPFAAGYQGEARPPSYSAIAVRSGSRPRGNTGLGSGRPGRPATARLPRGFTVAFNVVRAPSYSPRFPLRSLAMREFERLYPGAFKRAIESARSRR
jgi:hypothetical protein